MFLTKFFGKGAKIDVTEQKRIAIYRNLLRREAVIGGELFGPIPKGGRREFFCLDETTWVWHEEWTNKQGRRQVRNTRYDVRPSGILKAQNGQAYSKISAEEAKNFKTAVDLYLQRVKNDIYATA